MKTLKVPVIWISVLLLGTLLRCGTKEDAVQTKRVIYEPTWESLSQWKMPQWFDEAVLGIYCHWGVYSVPGYRFNEGSEQVDSGLWYGMFMYLPNGKGIQNYGVYDFHRKTYGEPCEAGYHELIPLFKAEKWDPDEWIELYKYAGADFAGLAAEHADAFIMWDSEFDEYNSMDKGPHRDLLGDLFAAARKAGLKTVVTFHEVPENMWDYGRQYCPEGEGVNNPDFASFYDKDPFTIQNKKLLEVVDKYQPDQIWFEDPYCGEENWLDFIAYYYNSAEKWGKEVFISQKYDFAPLSASVFDVEGGIFPDGIWHWAGMTEPQEQRWQKDVPIGNFWAYADGVGCRPVNMLVDGIVDRISKNGATLLNVSPKADGTLPQEQIDGLKELGDWMAINKEALYAAKPAHFIEGGADDWKTGTMRLVEKGDYLYAIELGNVWPTDKGFADYEESSPPTVPVVIPNLTPVEGSTIKMLGSEEELSWHMDGNDLVIEELPEQLPCGYAWSFKIQISD
jgi:alpha-L-fucosidase